MTFSRNQLADIKARMRLDDIARASGHELVREAGQWKTKCPFHKDDTPSLFIDPEKDGGVYYCHAGGCGAKGDVFAWVMKLEGLTFPEAVRSLSKRAGIELVEGNEKRANTRPQLVAQYHYKNVDGVVQYTIERWEPGPNGRTKNIIQRVPMDFAIANFDCPVEGCGAKRGEVCAHERRAAKKHPAQLLYNLAAVLKAVEAGELVFVVEGEKCADALAKHGLTATTNAGGAKTGLKTWTRSFAQPLARARIVLIPDNDQGGRDLMTHVAATLTGVASDVRLLTLDDLKDEGADVFDWFERGGTREQLLRLAAQAPLAVDDWAHELRTTRTGEMRPTIDNALAILEHHAALRGALYFDVRAYQPYTERPLPWDVGKPRMPRPIVDEDSVFCARWLSVEYDASFGVETAGRALWAVASRDQRDEIARYLDGLKWDRKSRVDTWLIDYAGVADTPYARAVARAWLVSAVGRALNPGCQADHVLVLEGAQGLKKSSLLRALAGDAYFGDTLPDISNKDASLVILRTWIQELAELEAIGKKETPTVRAFITRRVELFRPPYGKGVVSVPRRMVFCATTNEDDYLRDPAGNRRYWPVLCSVCNVDGLLEVRDQLWAEAVELYKTGEPNYLADSDMAAAAKAEQRMRERVDLWESKVERHLDGLAYTTLAEICGVLQLVSERQNQEASSRIVLILKKLGWFQPKTPVRVNGKRERRWYPPGSPEGAGDPPGDPRVTTSGSPDHRDHRIPSRARVHAREDDADRQPDMLHAASSDPTPFDDPVIHDEEMRDDNER